MILSIVSQFEEKQADLREGGQMKEKQKRKRKPWFRLLIGCLYHGAYTPVSYSLRQWLFDMIRPENLSIVAYDGMFRQGYCALADPDMNLTCWGQVNVIEGHYQYGFCEIETPLTSQKTCSDTPHQSV